MKIFRLVFLSLIVAVVTVGEDVLSSFSQGMPAEFAIARAVIGTGVENLEPVGVAETFPVSTEKVYCFLEARDISTDTEISLVWFHGGKELNEFSLNLQEGPRWRTYAYKNLYAMKGDWKVQVRASDGKVIAEIRFKVE